MSESRRMPTRQSARLATFIDLKPRPPIKRKRKVDSASVTATNGIKDQEDAPSDSEASPEKVSKLEDGESGDTVKKTEEMDVDEGSDEDQDMSSEEEHEEPVPHTRCPSVKLHSGAVNTPRSLIVKSEETEEIQMLLKRDRTTQRTAMDNKESKPKKEYFKGSSESYNSHVSSHPPSLPVRSSIHGYHQKMREESKVHFPRDKLLTGGQTTWQNNVMHRNKQQSRQQREQVAQKRPEVKKAAPTPSSTGCLWKLLVLLKWAVFLLVSLVLVVLGYPTFKELSVLTRAALARAVPAPKSTNAGEVFEARLQALELRFPSQHAELWRRSKIHLNQHLKNDHPTEPVSLILTSGRAAEKTVGCLARGLASAYSAARNASTFNLDGASMAGQDSDQVKLDIDTELRKAFDGSSPAAVIHRFEEIPPGATLIFYRYCDHENAAYKNVFLAFTVLLGTDTLGPGHSLSEVEQMVQEHIKDKFIPSDSPTTFNQMDIDKLSGLWSRISHLVLPVAAEEPIEQQGCPDL
ncbi:torsin-1A-interacting protein 2 [Chanos chanos]|uniref:Torsin-1A-interacting protein 2 n=1 Tax=Chanos chanos TaxID=29144 RepID=A0A6J2W8D6_CHACN|nr:torsin-1A-interacting protein 2-like [Chanos chanos]